MRNTFATRSIAAAARSHVHVDGCGAHGGTAIYTLADPRDVQSPRYVGQTRDPHTRFAQHVQMARLWLPDVTPWWVRSPKHRPLYGWIRELNRDGGRLPFMWVEEWVEPDADPLVAERAAIMRWLARGAALLNAEALKLGAQLPLLYSFPDRGFTALALGPGKVAEEPVGAGFALRPSGVVARWIVRQRVNEGRIEDGADTRKRQDELDLLEEALRLGRRGEHGGSVGRAT